MLPYVGTLESLMALDGEPIPDEPFDDSLVSAIDRDVVDEVLRIADAACDVLLDVEHRTIARRILARVAARDPRALRRSVHPARMAAALVWLAGRVGSGEFCRRARRQASDLWDLLDVGDCSDRGRTFQRVAGLGVGVVASAEPLGVWTRPIPVGDAAFLHSSLRRLMVDDRDFLLELDRERAMATWGPDGLVVRAAPLKPLLALKGTLDDTDRIGITVGFDDGTAEGWYLALSIPEAHQLVALLEQAIADPAPGTHRRALR
jgi:hypothetical protein